MARCVCVHFVVTRHDTGLVRSRRALAQYTAALEPRYNVELVEPDVLVYGVLVFLRVTPKAKPAS